MDTQIVSCFFGGATFFILRANHGSVFTVSLHVFYRQKITEPQATCQIAKKIDVQFFTYSVELVIWELGVKSSKVSASGHPAYEANPYTTLLIENSSQ